MTHNLKNLGTNRLDKMATFQLNELNDCYGIRPRPRHGQRSSHNNTILPLLSVDMQFEKFPVFLRDFSSRSEPEPLIAEPSTSDFKLHIGEDLKKAKDKHHLDCLVEKKQHVLDAVPPTGKAKIQIKGEQTIISCGSEKGKRNRRSAPCDCHCAC
ncbi:uncharacterized protein TNCV_2847401 [Trichonephila clavipes]|nr:uncharacterized protein TNCV_2847401 [Trichonephila clavipes]